MPIVEVRSRIDELLEGVAQLAPPDFERFYFQVLYLRAKRSAPEEAALLERIKQNLTPAQQQRYDQLTAKQREETLTQAEHQDLLDLLDIIDDIHLERVQALSELAKLRQIPFTELVAELGFSRRYA